MLTIKVFGYTYAIALQNSTTLSKFSNFGSRPVISKILPSVGEKFDMIIEGVCSRIAVTAVFTYSKAGWPDGRRFPRTRFIMLLVKLSASKLYKSNGS